MPTGRSPSPFSLITARTEYTIFNPALLGTLHSRGEPVPAGNLTAISSCRGRRSHSCSVSRASGFLHL